MNLLEIFPELQLKVKNIQLLIENNINSRKNHTNISPIYKETFLLFFPTNNF